MLKVSNLFTLFVIVLFTACSGKNVDGKNTKEVGQVGSCGENKITTLIGNDDYDLKDFEVKSIKSMKGGWMLNTKEKCRNVSVYLANYEIKMGLYAAKAPKNEGEYLIQVCYNGDYVSKEEALKDVTTGDFVVGLGATNVGKPFSICGSL